MGIFNTNVFFRAKVTQFPDFEVSFPVVHRLLFSINKSRV